MKTYEINTNQLEDDKKYKDKDKKILAFRGDSSSNVEKHPYVTEVGSDEDMFEFGDENVANEFAMINKKFKYFLNNKLDRSKGNFQSRDNG